MQSQDLAPLLTPITILDSISPSVSTADPFNGSTAQDFKAHPLGDSEHSLLPSSPIVAGLDYTFGVFIKEGTKRYFTLRMNSGFSGEELTLDIQGPSVLAISAGALAHNIVNVGNGWIWASITATAVSTTSFGRPKLFVQDDPVIKPYVGVGFEVDMSFTQLSLFQGTVELLPLQWDNLEPEQPPYLGTESWARVSIQHGLSDQRSMGEIGERRFERFGLVFIQVFTPRGQGVTLAEAFAKMLADALDGKRTPGGAWFSNTRSEDIDAVEDVWRQTNVISEFRYDEIK